MARCPFARWRPIPENQTQPRISPRAAILHSAVDAPGDTDLGAYFHRADVTVESHFYVRNHGELDQFLDTTVRADANYHANSFAVSIETEDDGNPNQRRWTAQQLDTLKRLLDWLCTVHPIPRRQIESPTGSGIGWHAMWNDNRGRTPWSVHAGKTCPGTARVPQIPALIDYLNRTEEDVTPEEHTALMQIRDALIADLPVGPYEGVGQRKQINEQMFARSDLKEIIKRLERIEAKVK